MTAARFLLLVALAMSACDAGPPPTGATAKAPWQPVDPRFKGCEGG